MIKVVFSPAWFSGIDSIFELVTVLVTALISVYGYKVYKFSGERRYKFFSLAFLLICVSYIIKILMNVSVYSTVTKKVQIGMFVFISQSLQRFELFYSIGFFLLRFLLLLGLIGIFLVLEKKEDRKYAFLLIYLAFISSLIGNYIFHIFHITASMLLLLIFVYYYNNYLHNKSKNPFLVASSFFLIMISQVVFILSASFPLAYVIGESLQLLGYILLLLALILILRR